MGMSLDGGNKKQVTSDINVVPLVDITLVLLIIFMVMTPLINNGRAVQLPQGADPEKKPDSDTDIVVSIVWENGEQHRLYYSKDTDPVSREQLVKELTELHERDSSVPLYIKADKRLRYGVVKDTMLACETTGFRSIGLVAEQLQ